MYKIGDTVLVKGRVKEIRITEGETLYKIAVYENNMPHIGYYEVIVREGEVLEVK